MFVRLTLAAAAAVLPLVAIAAPEPAPPGATAFRLGTMRLAALVDARNVVPNDGSVFGIDQTPEAVAAVLRAAGLPTDRVTLSVDALLVRTGDRVVLIDTGLGPKAGGALMASLAAAGATPGEVTDVLITHSHGDHVGGLLDADGRLAFPRATIRMAAAEWSAMQARPQAGAMVAAIAPRVKTFAPGAMVAPGITSVAITGHTPGHVGYRLRSRGQSLLDTGDTAHSSVISLAHPAWAIEYDGNQAAARAAREATLAALAKSGERVWAPHFPYPGLGTIAARGEGYVFVPAPL